jgi:NitT/TauT family transport system ATP-binding protein
MTATTRPSQRPASMRPPQLRGRVEAKGLCKRFGTGAHGAGIENVDLECDGGEFIVVVGPSGCGKSTLLNLVAGTITPDRGTVLLDGKPVVAPGPERAVVFQEHSLFPWLDVEDNVAFGLKMRGVPVSERRDRVAEVLRAVRLPDAGKKLVHELSGGMKQRVAIARALILDPAMLLMDEPFAAVDAHTRTALHEHLQDIWCEAKKTILFITHSVGEAVRLADHIIIMGTNPGHVQKRVTLDLPHPRDFDSRAISEAVGEIRAHLGGGGDFEAVSGPLP